MYYNDTPYIIKMIIYIFSFVTTKYLKLLHGIMRQAVNRRILEAGLPKATEKLFPVTKLNW